MLNKTGTYLGTVTNREHGNFGPIVFGVICGNQGFLPVGGRLFSPKTNWEQAEKKCLELINLFWCQLKYRLADDFRRHHVEFQIWLSDCTFSAPYRASITKKQKNHSTVIAISDNTPRWDFKSPFCLFFYFSHFCSLYYAIKNMFKLSLFLSTMKLMIW